ncbi:BlaI/MecI/CopY family transcriptional regulator [Streptomyces roseoverticillatus]|uniref:BlaI/MecI/CopY family transcriptional regulator n=1 Tax=Streptomyces roseoverticillatus TaxID=66429 RepID=UPI0034067BC7
MERVSQEREQVRAEIAALQQRLEVLEADHQQLLKLQATLTGEPVAAERPPLSITTDDVEAGPKTSARVPRPRSAKAPASARAGRRGAKKTGRGEPTWGEILLSYLEGQQQPLSVAEITNGVSAAHLARTVQATAVRTTLEGLVARGKVQRSKQGRSVAYSLVGRQVASEQGLADVASSESA